MASQRQAQRDVLRPSGHGAGRLHEGRDEGPQPSELTEQRSSDVWADSEAASRPELKTEEQESRMPRSSSSSWDPPLHRSSLQANAQETNNASITRLRALAATQTAS